MKPIGIKISSFIAFILLTVSCFSYAQEKKGDENFLSADPREEIFQLETIVVTGTASEYKKQEIESRKLRLHNVVDFAETRFRGRDTWKDWKLKLSRSDSHEIGADNAFLNRIF